MLRLPSNLPSDIRRALMPCLAEASLYTLLERLSVCIAELFHCVEVLVWFDHAASSNTLPQTSAIFRVPNGPAAGGIESAVIEKWQASGVHERVRKDLSARLSSISFSAFSWRYPHFTVAGEGGQSFTVPREYTLCLPFSSDALAGSDTDPVYFGYFALFFNRFPKLSDNAVQLIITLPDIISQLAAAHLRRSQYMGGGQAAAFAHDIKRHVLISREFINKIKTGDPKERRQAADGLERSLLRMLGETNAVLLCEKESHGGLKVNPIPIPLNDLVREAAAEIAPLFDSAGVKLRLELGPELPDIPLDPALFPSVVFNLLDNALKYGAGNEVTVRTYRDADGALCLEAADNGALIAQADLPFIFDKSYRGANARGTAGNGLGLYLVRRLVEAHSGSVRVEQRTPAGKKFIARLQAAADGQ